MANPRISVVLVAHNMQREIPRTLRSLAPDYQRGIAAEDYEVIVVDNGSTQPFDEKLCRSFGLRLVIHRIDPAPPSPARAINQGLALAKGELIGAVIDGARMASPGLLGMAMRARRLHDRPVIATLGFHLGPEIQMVSVTKGYDQQAEDRLLGEAQWADDGYRLFSISSLAGSSQGGWFAPMLESNALFLPRGLWQELGGFDEAFTSAGGGFVNADLFVRACRLPDSQVIVLLGEGVFHQVHGGIATNNPNAPQRLWLDEYARIRGHEFEPPVYTPWLFGRVVPEVLPSIEDAARQAVRSAPPATDHPPPGPDKVNVTLCSRALLNGALDDYRDALGREHEWRKERNYPLNQFWGNANQIMIAQALDESQSAEEAVARILESDLYVHHVDAPLVDKSIDWHLRKYKDLGCDVDQLSPGVQESFLFPAREVRQRAGRRLSPDFFRHCYVAHRAATIMSGKSRPRILELGAGIGNVARLFREIHGSANYFICDIPETLIFARLFLSLTQPAARILWAHDAGELEREDTASYDYVLVPTALSGSLRAHSFDLFMNFHSLGEFDNEAIRFWMGWLQGAERARHIFVCNRYLNLIEPGRHDWRLRENEASVSFDDRWRPIAWEVEPGHLACPYIGTMQSRYLLFLAADEPPQPEQMRKTEGERALAAALEMNALRVLTAGPPTSFRLAMLAHDLTMTGPLFHLWNAARLTESAETLFHLVRYLDCLFPPGHRFVEERPFYLQKLRKRLAHEPPGAYPEIERWVQDAQHEPKSRQRNIRLVSSYKGYNLVEIDGAVVALRQDLGPIDLDKERVGERELPPFILRSELSDFPSRIAELEARIEALSE
jgi:glycosyl transferase family 2